MALPRPRRSWMEAPAPSCLRAEKKVEALQAGPQPVRQPLGLGLVALASLCPAARLLRAE